MSLVDQVHMDYLKMLGRADRIYQRAQKEVDLELNLGAEVDEVALLFENREALDHWLKWAITRGNLEHFNSVPHDTMLRRDRSGAFAVRFEFLRLPGATWRIEAMCVLYGNAPLHETALALHRNGCVIHASYKATSLEGYAKCQEELRSRDVSMAAEYQNSYGRFSYWGNRGDFYLKPRVNLRDPAQ